jgi:short subunit fatty acids transporter
MAKALFACLIPWGIAFLLSMMLAKALLQKAQNGQSATASFFATLQSIITLLLLGAWYLSGQ